MKAGETIDYEIGKVMLISFSDPLAIMQFIFSRSLGKIHAPTYFIDRIKDKMILMSRCLSDVNILEDLGLDKLKYSSRCINSPFKILEICADT